VYQLDVDNGRQDISYSDLVEEIGGFGRFCEDPFVSGYRRPTSCVEHQCLGLENQPVYGISTLDVEKQLCRASVPLR
jgi:hypothetical protein